MGTNDIPTSLCLPFEPRVLFMYQLTLCARLILTSDGRALPRPRPLEQYDETLARQRTHPCKQMELLFTPPQLQRGPWSGSPPRPRWCSQGWGCRCPNLRALCCSPSGAELQGPVKERCDQCRYCFLIPAWRNLVDIDDGDVKQFSDFSRFQGTILEIVLWFADLQTLGRLACTCRLLARTRFIQLMDHITIIALGIVALD